MDEAVVERRTGVVMQGVKNSGQRLTGDPSREELVEKRLSQEEKDHARNEEQRGDPDDAFHLGGRRQEIEEALDGVQLPLRLRIQLGRKNRCGCVCSQEREELVIDGREDALILEQLVDRDNA